MPQTQHFSEIGMRGFNKALALLETQPSFPFLRLQRDTFRARLSNLFGKDENSGMPHLPQSLNQWQRLPSGHFGDQQPLAFENQPGVGLDVTPGIRGSAHQTYVMRARAL